MELKDSSGKSKMWEDYILYYAREDGESRAKYGAKCRKLCEFMLCTVAAKVSRRRSRAWWEGGARICGVYRSVVVYVTKSDLVFMRCAEEHKHAVSLMQIVCPLHPWQNIQWASTEYL